MLACLLTQLCALLPAEEGVTPLPPPPPPLVLHVRVINCTSSGDGFIKPLATHIDASTGVTSRRITIPTTGANNLTGLGSNFAIFPPSPVSGSLRGFVEASDEPPHYHEGIRNLLAEVEFDSASSPHDSGGAVVNKRQVVPKTVTNTSAWNTLPARWLIPTGTTTILARHRTLTEGGGVPPSSQEWVELIDIDQEDAGGGLLRSTVVYNRSVPLAPDGSMLPGLFGEEYAFDPARGVLYSQGCRRSATGGGAGLWCEWATDLVAWDVQEQQQVASLPMLNTTLLAMHWDPSPAAAPHSIGALVLDGQQDDPILGTLNRFKLVGVNPRAKDGALIIRPGEILLPARLQLRGAGSAFAAKTRTLALLMVEPTGHSDWSNGDPKALVSLQVQLPLPSLSSAGRVGRLPVLPAELDVLGVMPECQLGADLRFMDPTLTFIEV